MSKFLQGAIIAGGLFAAGGGAWIVGSHPQFSPERIDECAAAIDAYSPASENPVPDECYGGPEITVFDSRDRTVNAVDSSSGQNFSYQTKELIPLSSEEFRYRANEQMGTDKSLVIYEQIGVSIFCLGAAISGLFYYRKNGVEDRS